MTTTGTIDTAGLDGGPVSLASEQLDALDTRVQGRLLRPGDQGWNEAVSIWNGMAARLPALVLQPTSAHDVGAAVGFARDNGLLLSVKGGGHNIAGTSIAEGGLTLDMSRMREVAVDPNAKLVPGSASACTRSAQPSPAASSSGAPSGPRRCWPPTATSPNRRRGS
jgi:hypothetical protein